MPRMIQVRTGARLHFGPLASGVTNSRCFGGIGMMVAQPAIVIRAVESVCETYSGCSSAVANRIQAIRNAWSLSSRGETSWLGECQGQGGECRKASPPSLSSISWEFESSPIEHAGLGTGTQLSLAVASILSRLEGGEQPCIKELARRTGRGQRSAIGSHGFSEGGFLVDAGKPRGDAIGDLALRVPVPDEWRILLIRSRDAGSGLSGQGERAAFDSLPPMPSLLTDRLCRLTLMEILPAIQAHDCAVFLAAVGEYGRLIGDYFAPVQGGVFASPRVRDVIEKVPELGPQLIQSSWGPSVVTVAPSEEAAIEFCHRWSSALSPKEWSIDITSPLNTGAIVNELESAS